MKESTLIKTVNVLWFVAAICLYHGLLYYFTLDDKDRESRAIATKTEVIQPEEPKKEPNPHLRGYYELLTAIETVKVRYVTIETDYIGVCFITAYCPEECGYNGENYPNGWTTSSGAICHYSDSNFEPTTCAIDRRHFPYSMYLMVDGKVYVTEDTGPGVQGFHIDVFRPDYQSMSEFGSHYSEVYSVQFITKTVSVRERRLKNEWFRNYLRNRGICFGFGCGYGC